MADKKYYCLCGSNCKYETMTKEQILTAITQAVNEGTVGNIDTGFITSVKTINGTPLRFFVGTQSEFEMLTEEERENLFAIITNDTTKEAFEEMLETLSEDVSDILNGRKKVVSATTAENADISDVVSCYSVGTFAALNEIADKGATCGVCFTSTMTMSGMTIQKDSKGILSGQGEDVSLMLNDADGNIYVMCRKNGTWAVTQKVLSVKGFEELAAENGNDMYFRFQNQLDYNSVYLFKVLYNFQYLFCGVLVTPESSSEATQARAALGIHGSKHLCLDVSLSTSSHTANVIAQGDGASYLKNTDTLIYYTKISHLKG